MKIDLAKLEGIRKRRDQAVADLERAKGRMEEIMRTLKKEFQCDSVEEAETLLEKLREDATEAADKFETNVKKFEADWGEV